MSNIKGIILAGGHGSRLFPLTIGTSKQLLAVYDKPMIYYPMYTLMLAGIKEILIISTPEDLPRYNKLFGNGNMLGLKISYEKQIKPNGIAESFIIGKKFIGNSHVCLVLGDNIFYGDKLVDYLKKGLNNLKKNSSTIYGLDVINPKEFGVVKFDSKNNLEKIVEKPKLFISNTIVSGLYMYTNDVIEIVKNLKPSSRNELEITDINNIYINKTKLRLIKLEKDISWIDTGTYDSMLKASNFFQELEKKTGEKYACIEHMAFQLSYIDEKQFLKLARLMSNSSYGKYLLNKLKK